MIVKGRIFKIKDIDCISIVEIVNKQKDILDIIDEYTENMKYDFFDPSDDSFQILYKDGSFDYIGLDYDGHKIRKNNILSMVHNNPCTSTVYGNFSINEYGVVNTSAKEEISSNNIEEIK